MRIRLLALACVTSIALCACGADSGADSGAAGRVPARTDSAPVVTAADIKACQDFRSWYRRARPDLTDQGKMAQLILANGDGATGQLGQDISVLGAAVLAAAEHSLVSAEAGQVRQDCAQVDAGAPGPAPSLPATGRGSDNARRIAYALASNNPATISALTSAVAGKVMLAYIGAQALAQQAYAQNGQSGPPGTVTAIAGGFQVCFTAASCQSYTGFTFSDAGLVTGFSVDGSTIASRITTAVKAKGAGLVISNVTGYLYTGTGELGVIFKVRDVGPRAYGGSTPFLPVLITFGGTRYEYDPLTSQLPGDLRPGESAAAIAFFHTTTIAGRFSLRTNDQLETVLVYTRLLRSARS